MRFGQKCPHTYGIYETVVCHGQQEGKPCMLKAVWFYRHAICWCTLMQTRPLALGYFFLKHLILFHLSQLIDVCLLPLPLDILDCGICMDIYKPRLVSPLPIQPHIRTYQRPGSFAFSDLPKATARGGKIADVHPLLWQVPACFQRPAWKKLIALIESPNNMIFDVQWPRTYILEEYGV